jgi:hypothetical protein
VYSFKVIISYEDFNAEHRNRNDLESKTILSTVDLAKEFNNMKAVNEISFSFEPDPVFCDLESFWLLKTSKKKGFFKKRFVFDYYLELYFKYPDGKTGLCGYNTYSFDEVETMITKLINHQKFPDISSWIMTKWDASGKVLSFDESNPNWKG